MSSSMYWEPVDRRKHVIPFELKHVIIRKWECMPKVLNANDLDYLNGLADGGIISVIRLIEAIEKYGAIELTEEF